MAALVSLTFFQRVVVLSVAELAAKPADRTATKPATRQTAPAKAAPVKPQPKEPATPPADCTPEHRAAGHC